MAESEGRAFPGEGMAVTSMVCSRLCGRTDGGDEAGSKPEPGVRPSGH